MIYLDWNATTPLEPAAEAAWLRAQREAWANPSAAHAFGQQARHVLDQAKAGIARILGGSAAQWIVTSGGSESNSLAIASALVEGGRACAAATEHSSILAALAARAQGVTTLAVDACGRIRADRLPAALDPAPAPVCLSFANNETGVRQDLPALCARIRDLAPSTWIHSDGAQGPGRVQVDVAALGCDSFSVAAHKFGAPKGVGLLWVRPGRRIIAQIHGGRQQQDRRSGTEDAPRVCAVEAALAARQAGLAAEAERQAGLVGSAFAAIRAARPAAQWIGQAAARLPHVLSLGLPGQRADTLVTRLDLAGIAVSRGSACQAAKDGPSPIIAALGLDEALARSVIRVSIGWGTTAEELAAFVSAYLDVTA